MNRKLKFSFSAAAIIIVTFPPFHNSVDAQGASAIPVCTVKDLAHVENDLTADYVQVCDIDLSARYWTSLGKPSFMAFQGTFDGQGHVIANLRGPGGLFDRVTGTVRNVKLTNVALNTSSASDVGALVNSLGALDQSPPKPKSPSLIDSCTASGSITYNLSEYVGGLVGTAFGPIRNSGAAVNLVPYNPNGNGHGIGGLAGYSMYEISNSTATGNVTGVSGAAAGGFVGIMETGTITGSLATGNVQGDHPVGGLVGSMNVNSYNVATISGSRATGKESGVGDVGGLVGWVYGLPTRQCVISNSSSSGGRILVNGVYVNPVLIGGQWPQAVNVQNSFAR